MTSSRSAALTSGSALTAPDDGRPGNFRDPLATITVAATEDDVDVDVDIVDA